MTPIPADPIWIDLDPRGHITELRPEAAVRRWLGDTSDPTGQPVNVLLRVGGRPCLIDWSAVQPAEQLTLRVDAPTGPALASAVRRGEGVRLTLQPIDPIDHRIAWHDRLVASVRHEARTPLTVLKTVTALLDEEPDMAAADRAAFTDSLRRESARVGAILEDLLTVERLAAGRGLVRPEPVLIDGWWGGVLRHLRPFSAQHGVRLDVQDPPKGLAVTGERHLLDQLARNLVGHALRGAATGLRVDIAFAVDEDRVRVVVRDDSPGLDGAEREEAFTTFRRSTASGKYVPGVGLGLPIAKRIADAHGFALRHLSRREGWNSLVLEAPATPTN